MRFDIWNVRILYRGGSLTTAARELVRNKLHLVGVQEVRCSNEGTIRAGDYNFFYGKETKNVNWERDFFVHHTIVSTVKRE